MPFNELMANYCLDQFGLWVRNSQDGFHYYQRSAYLFFFCFLNSNLINRQPLKKKTLASLSKSLQKTAIKVAMLLITIKNYKACYHNQKAEQHQSKRHDFSISKFVEAFASVSQLFKSFLGSETHMLTNGQINCGRSGRKRDLHFN